MAMPAAALVLAAGAVLSASRTPLWKRLVFLFLYVALFAVVFFVSVETDAPGWAPLGIAALFVGVAWRFGRTWRSATLFLVMGLLVAYYSGSQGSAGPMSGWLFDLGWLSPQVVEGIVIAFRKTVHVVFYGGLAAVGWMVARETVGGPRAGIIAAWAWALAHALFDESRQMATPGRSGSWWDVLLDAGAMVFALFWIARRMREQEWVPN